MITKNNSNNYNITDIFENVSHAKYDLMNDIMSLGIHRIWKNKLLDWMNPQPNSSLIDVASGTGDIAKLFLEKINYKGSVCCLDENKGMLEISKKKNR